MGAVLEMMTLRACIGLALLSAVALSGCGSDTDIQDYRNQAAVLGNAVKAARTRGGTGLAAMDSTAIAALRSALEKDGQPIYLVINSGAQFTDLMAPYGQNADVQTWSSMHYETISLRQGMLVASRGFGADLMSSVGPSVARIAQASGTTNRSYFYLDGADKTQRYDFTCSLSPAGTETVVVLGRSYATLKVNESCSGVTGSFNNTFWFDSGTNLRQSSQMITVGLDNLVLQRVID